MAAYSRRGTRSVSEIRADCDGAHGPRLWRRDPTSDQEIRTALHAAIRADGSLASSVVADEVRLSKGTARADLVVVSGSELWILEIKSDRDSLARLREQSEPYSATADRLTLVVGWKLAAAALRIAPRWWEVWLAERCGLGDLRFVPLRDGGSNPSGTRPGLDRLVQSLSNSLVEVVRDVARAELAQRAEPSAGAEGPESARRLVVREALRARQLDRSCSHRKVPVDPEL